MAGFFGTLEDLFLHSPQRVHEFVYFPLAVQLLVVLPPEQLYSLAEVVNQISE